LDKICQLASICNRHCAHRWKHSDSGTLGCSEEGCSKRSIEWDIQARDEFNQIFTGGQLRQAWCVDYEYFKETISWGSVIVTKGTYWEGWKERERIRKADEDRIRRGHANFYEEMRRQQNVDFVQEQCFMQYAMNEYEHRNREEAQWRGAMWTNWG
jgi:hypothetical protein